MKYRNQFALAVRLFGVWLITQGAIYVAAFIDGKLYPQSDKARDSAAANLIYAAIDFGLAAFFLLWTRVIVAWTYSEEPGSANPVEDSVDTGTSVAFNEPRDSKTHE
jgi:hypothetical protein